MSKSVIYTGNSATQTTTENGTTVSFPNIVRRYGCNLDVSGGNVVATGTGYYDIDVNLTIVGTATGTADVQVYSNGTPIPYATADVVTTTDSINSVTIPCMLRNTCNCISNTITVEISGAVVDVTNASILVEKE